MWLVFAVLDSATTEYLFPLQSQWTLKNTISLNDDHELHKIIISSQNFKKLWTILTLQNNE